MTEIVYSRVQSEVIVVNVLSEVDEDYRRIELRITEESDVRETEQENPRITE